jgi:ubiquinone/menaquinone biosynthesis C-methylase UbiE
MHDEQVLIEAFTEMAPQYERKVDSELRRFWGWTYSSLVDHVLSLTPVRRQDRVLDIATGTSVIPQRMLQKGQIPASISGLDITYPMLAAGKKKMAANHPIVPIFQTCGSALCMPYGEGVFDLILCGLATHHMDVPILLSEISRVMAPDGRLTIADVGASPVFRKPGVSSLIRIAAYLYFLLTEGPARAKTEAGALPHVYTADEWTSHLTQAGFRQVQINRLESSHKWSPAPLIMRARKS